MPVAENAERPPTQHTVSPRSACSLNSTPAFQGRFQHGPHGHGVITGALRSRSSALFEFTPLDVGRPRWLAFDHHKVALASITLRKRRDPSIAESGRLGQFQPLPHLKLSKPPDDRLHGVAPVGTARF